MLPTKVDWEFYSIKLAQGDRKHISRVLSLVENEAEGYFNFLKKHYSKKHIPVIGFTGAPGSGKSSVINKIIYYIIHQEKKSVAILCIDPSSPFHHGAILGDRIRMTDWNNSQNVFIRSLSSKGNLGGLNPKIYELVDVIKMCPFDYIFIETVGVGQSEIDINMISDIVNIILVPEAGDIIQNIKSGLMEIGDIYIINKADREGADLFAKNLEEALHYGYDEPNQKNIIQVSTLTSEGIETFYNTISSLIQKKKSSPNLDYYYFKALHFIFQKIINSSIQKKIRSKIQSEISSENFNFYHWVENFHKTLK